MFRWGKKKEITIDIEQVTDVYVDGVSFRDYPDFCDAYVESALYYGREMTEEELDVLNNDHRDFVYEYAVDSIW